MAVLNGSPVTAKDALQLGLVNYGHYTSMRVAENHVRGLSQHLDRLVHDCKVLFDADLDRDLVRKSIREATANRRDSFIVRVTIFDPKLEFGRPSVSAEPRVLVTIRPAPAWPLMPIRVQAVSYRRDLPAVKHVGLFGALWGRRKAQLAGFDDAVFVDGASFISEGATWNVGFYDGDRVVWPNADVLPGVTMRLLKQVHERTMTAPVNLGDVSKMQAVFATNTSVGVRAISSIDQVEVPGDHPIINTLREEYEEIPPEKV